jgi:hypothetical protein
MTLERIPEIVDGLPNISGWEDEVRAVTRSKKPVFLLRITVDLERMRAAFASLWTSVAARASCWAAPAACCSASASSTT